MSVSQGFQFLYKLKNPRLEDFCEKNNGMNIKKSRVASDRKNRETQDFVRREKAGKYPGIFFITGHFSDLF